MPRQSRAELAMAAVIQPRARTPVQPPACLSEPARKAFVELVTDCAPDHFEPAE